jgi:hypothetical protein
LLERTEVHARVVDARDSKADVAALFDERIESEVVAANFSGTYIIKAVQQTQK